MICPTCGGTGKLPNILNDCTTCAYWLTPGPYKPDVCLDCGITKQFKNWHKDNGETATYLKYYRGEGKP